MMCSTANSLSPTGCVRSARRIQLRVPGSDQYFRYELLAAVPDADRAGQTVVVPYRITALQALPGNCPTAPALGMMLPTMTPQNFGVVAAAAMLAQANGGGCTRYSRCVPHEVCYECPWGEKVVISGTICGSYTSGSCPPDEARYGGGGGGGGGGGSSASPRPRPIEGKWCEPPPCDCKPCRDCKTASRRRRVRSIRSRVPTAIRSPT
ncbi:MAG: hypothetical protein R3F11_18455 [Verrucomicrobiales bacterium]